MSVTRRRWRGTDLVGTPGRDHPASTSGRDPSGHTYSWVWTEFPGTSVGVGRARFARLRVPTPVQTTPTGTRSPCLGSRSVQERGRVEVSEPGRTPVVRPWFSFLLPYLW